MIAYRITIHTFSIELFPVKCAQRTNSHMYTNEWNWPAIYTKHKKTCKLNLYLVYISICPLTQRVIGAPLRISQPAASISVCLSVFHSPLCLRKVQSCPLPVQIDNGRHQKQIMLADLCRSKLSEVALFRMMMRSSWEYSRPESNCSHLIVNVSLSGTDDSTIHTM